MKSFFGFFRIWSALLLGVVAMTVVSCKKDSGGAPTSDPNAGFTAREGLYGVMEGNFYSSENGALLYLGKGVTSLPTLVDAYAVANPGHEVGGVLEDIFFAGDKLYLLTQKGDQLGGDGQLVVADAATFKAITVYKDLGLGADNNPEHLVVVGDKAFIQYAVTDMETQSGIRVFDLSTGTSAAADIAGTFGDFTVDGATKCRMLLSRGMIYSPCGQKLNIIDPASAAVVKTVDFTGRQVKDIVKGNAGDLYAVVSGTYDLASGDYGSYVSDYTSPASMVHLDHGGHILGEQAMPSDWIVSADSWSPNVGMCASLNSGKIFFFGANSSSTVYCYNTDTKQFASPIDLTALGVELTTGGYMCVDPVSNTLVVPVSDYTPTTTFALLDASTFALKAYDATAAAPVSYCAGVDCSYRFLPSYISK